jgi:hypothetical protein
VEWYTFVWSQPEGIPWGGQVQDGGAVLGFAFHDQMARLAAAGPDAAWEALKRTLDWFADVRREGGYRAYYATPGRGTLQGGGTAGGLGMDAEFFESVLVPQIMLYGFLGLRVAPDGLTLDPALPAEWPSLDVTRVRFRDVVLDIRATRRELRIRSRGDASLETTLALPPDWAVTGIDGTPAAPGGPARIVLGEGRTFTARRTPHD